MIANVILGVNIDTIQWIRDLKADEFDHIFVLDYNHLDEPLEKDSVTYFSAYDMKCYLKKFDTVVFYKSLYSYPGMSGKMASLYKKQKEE